MRLWWKGRVLKFKSLLIDKKYKIEPAFELGGVQYYQFASVTDMPVSRGLSALWIYDEFKMKADERYLKLHVKAVNQILSGEKGKINLNILRDINRNLEERMGLAAISEHIYKLASVHFFDATESIYEYDAKHAEEKMKLWRSQPETLGFFLTQPLKPYLPFSDMPLSDVLTFLKIADQIAETHLKGLPGRSSKKE